MAFLGEWQNPYLSLLPEYESRNRLQFGQLCEKRLCCSLQEADFTGAVPATRPFLQEAEVEYAEETSPSIYVAFPPARHAACQGIPGRRPAKGLTP